MIGTRKSYRIYTHALVSPAWVRPEGSMRWDRGEDGETRHVSNAGEQMPATIHSYAGRLDLAEKQQRAHPDLVIVPVDQEVA